jgi:hypothetical protein
VQRSTLVAAVALVVLLSLVGTGCVYTNNSQQENDAQLNLKYNSSHAVEITMNDPVVSEYMSRYYSEPDWRVIRTTLVHETPSDQYDTAMQESNVWKVEIMERSCACQGVDDLYVLEGYVSADTGELLEVSKMKVSESNYDKQTCASTVCH